MVLRDTLKDRGYICGLMIRLVRNPAVCCLQKNAGMDFIMLDCEHGNYSMETLHDLFIMARGMGIGAMVRLPEGTKTWVSRVLDAGAAGFLVPYCETREQVETLVYYAKYKPVGNRGFCPAGGHTNYAGGAAKDILPYQNDRVIAMAQIESKKAVELRFFNLPDFMKNTDPKTEEAPVEEAPAAPVEEAPAPAEEPVNE